MTREQTLSARIADGFVALFAFAAGGAIIAPVILVALFPFAG